MRFAQESVGRESDDKADCTLRILCEEMETVDKIVIIGFSNIVIMKYHNPWGQP